MDKCIICCTNTVNIAKTCYACQFNSCIGCNKTYILGSINDAHCMNCKKSWNREMLINMFSYNFINKDYKKYRKNVLFDRQISLLPQTQSHIELTLHLKRLSEETYKLANAVPTGVSRYQKIIHLWNDYTLDKNVELLEKELKIYKAYKEKIDEYNLKNDNGGGDNGVLNNTNQIRAHVQKQRRQMVLIKDKLNGKEQNKSFNEVKYYGHCPEPNCKGYINSTWKCGICNTNVCKSCKESLTKSGTGGGGGTGHKCDPNILENIRKIREDSKMCPNCKIYITRIDGCKQMFCTNCNTAFDWLTGELITKNIHNPHYFEWLKTSGNGGNDINGGQCNNENNERLIRYVYRAVDAVKNNGKLTTKCSDILRFLNFMANKIETLQRDLEKDKFLKLRVQYITRELAEDKFKNKIYNLEKLIEKKNDLLAIYEMFYNTCCDYTRLHLYKKYIVVHSPMTMNEIRKDDVLFAQNVLVPIYGTNNYYLLKPSVEKMELYINTIDSLRLYVNKCFNNLNGIYKYKIKEINTNYEDI